MVRNTWNTIDDLGRNNPFRIGEFNTLEEQLDWFYGGMQKSMHGQKDAPVISTTTGVFNAIYGAEVFADLNFKAPTWGALPKRPWDKSGWRIATAAGQGAVGTGVAENGNIPATKKPTFQELSAKPKLMAMAFDMSMSQQILAGSDDGVDYATLRDLTKDDHINSINRQLQAPVTTVITNDIDSIDRVCSSKSEEDTLLTDGDADIYGINRSAATTWDAYVDHASGIDRQLSTTILDNAIQNIQDASGEMPNLIITGYDTLDDINALISPQQRFVNVTMANGITVNDAQTAGGVDAGFTVNTYRGIPIVPDSNVSKDTKSRVYFLNTDYIYIRLAVPTQLYETGVTTTGDPFPKNSFLDEGVFLTAAELICTKFGAQGKIRDLS